MIAYLYIPHFVSSPMFSPKRGGAMEIQFQGEEVGEVTWIPPESVQNLMRKLEEEDLEKAEQFALFIEHVLRIFLSIITLSIINGRSDAPPEIVDTVRAALVFVLSHQREMFTEIGRQEVIPPSPSGPDDDPEQMRKIWQKIFSARRK